MNIRWNLLKRNKSGKQDMFLKMKFSNQFLQFLSVFTIPDQQ